MDGITTRKDGRRIYVEGKTFDIKDRLKAVGGHWDPDKKAWWVSTSKEDDLDKLLDAAEMDAGKPRYGQTFVADTDKGVCAKCGKPVLKGFYARYRYPGKVLEHVNCERAAAAVAKMEAKKQNEKAAAPYRLSGGSGYGCHGWSVGQTLRTSERQRENGWPEFVTVVKANRRYFREDGMSFGVGDDRGYVYSADCREATPEEIAPVKARGEAAEAVKTAKAEVEAIKSRIKAEGERPAGDNIPDGDRLFDTQTIYGGGDWFVVGPEWIWYVRNNGGDGDSWGDNNVRTGGAGAIGWRVPYSRDIAGDLYRLEGIVDPDGAKKRKTEKTVAAREGQVIFSDENRTATIRNGRVEIVRKDGHKIVVKPGQKATVPTEFDQRTMQGKIPAGYMRYDGIYMPAEVAAAIEKLADAASVSSVLENLEGLSFAEKRRRQKEALAAIKGGQR